MFFAPLGGRLVHRNCSPDAWALVGHRHVALAEPKSTKKTDYLQASKPEAALCFNLQELTLKIRTRSWPPSIQFYANNAR